MKKQILLVTIFILGFLVRFVGITTAPAGLNADEAAIGYNAWSLINTGMDEHGESWPLVFRSFDDFKPPVYFYLVLPFVKFLGLSVLAVRLPSVILGTLTLVFFYYLVQFLFAKRNDEKKVFWDLPLISTIILSFSPWHIHFSRGGWEVNAALFFIVLGLYSFFASFKNSSYLYLFSTSLAVSLYTYHSARILSPLLALVLIIVYWKNIFPNGKLSSSKFKIKTLVLAIILGLALSLPIAKQMLSKEGQSRFAGVSLFSDEGPLWQALEMRQGHNKQNLYTRLVHSKYLTYSLRFTKNYLTHFSPRFLFIEGDEIARSKVPSTGQFLLSLAPFYLIGLYSLLKLNSKGKKFTLLWLLVAPLAASLTFQSPHALRAHNMVIPLSIILGLGVLELFNYFKKNLAVLGILGILNVYFFAIYLHQYFYVYPRVLPFAWQYGFDQIASYIKENEDKYDKIIITDRYDQPYILIVFFQKYPPQKLQNELVMTPRDKFGFSTVRNLGKYEFKRVNFSQDMSSPNTLIIAADESVDDSKVIDTIKDPAGNIMYKILSTSQTNAKK